MSELHPRKFTRSQEELLYSPELQTITRRQFLKIGTYATAAATLGLAGYGFGIKDVYAHPTHPLDANPDPAISYLAQIQIVPDGVRTSGTNKS